MGRSDRRFTTKSYYIAAWANGKRARRFTSKARRRAARIECRGN